MNDKKISLIISNNFINSNDLLLTFSEIKNDKSKTYKDLINHSLNLMFKNKNTFNQQIAKLNEILSNNKYSVQLIYLDKFSKIINNIEQGQIINNACIVIKFDSYINDININTISFFTNIEKEEKDQFKFNLKRIEFDNNNINFDSSIQNLKIEIKDECDNNTTPIYNIEDLIKNANNFFSWDDYNHDELKLKKWRDVISILQRMYDNNQNHLNNHFFKFNNNIYLGSKSEINNEKNLVITENNELINDTNIKYINKKELSLLNKINDYINQLEKQIEENQNNKRECLVKKNDCEDEYKKINQKINDNIKEKNNFEQLKEKNTNLISKYNSDIQNLNKRIEELRKKKNIDQNVVNNEIENYFNYIKNLEREKSKYQLKSNELSLKINDICQSLKELKNNLTNIKSDINKYKNQINEYELTIKINGKKIDNINFSLKELKNYNFFYLINNIEFIEETKFELIQKNINDISENNNPNKISIDRNDVANAVKVKRYYHAINQLNSGYYKNFNLFKSIKNPSCIFSFQYDVPDNIRQKYNLNKKQLSSVQKAINIDDIFYLQGPPGTGKTQTLCAICESVIKRGDNLLMCSSTHEAINNFLERLADNNRNNPNVIIFKYKFISTKEEQSTYNNERFSEKKLYQNFKNCIYNNLIKNNENEKILFEYIQKYQYEIPKIKKGITFLSTLNKIGENFDFFQNNIESFNIIGDDGEYLFPFDECYNGINHENIKNVIVKLKKYYEYIQNSDINLYNQIIAFDNVINSHINENNINLILDMNNIITKLDNNQKELMSEKIQKIKNNYDLNNNYDDDFENKFLDYIFENNMINVIGITTTSRQSIQINNKSKNLFSDYNIETMLIDEISKSSTPEILAKAVLSKKIILSGDYRQLPPSPEFCSSIELNQLKEFIIKTSENNSESLNKNDTFKRWSNIIKNENWEKQLKDEIVDLFKTSFFVIQVNKLKNNSFLEKNKAYEFLNESWRFSGKILDLVNIIYDDNEKLKKINDINNKFNLYMNNKNLNSELVMVDTSIFDNNFFQKYHNSNIENNDSYFTFDQIGEPFDLKNEKINLNSDSLYNQYTAIVIIEIIMRIINDNPEKFNKETSTIQNKIGVITLTKTQKKIVKQYINKLVDKSHHKYIKVDTIDNFQGREEEIIIVDFIRGQNKINSKKIYYKKQRNLSFLEEIERINVAISRPKSKLILVGSFRNYLNNLKVNKYGNLFKKYYDYIDESNDSYVMFGGK